MARAALTVQPTRRAVATGRAASRPARAPIAQAAATAAQNTSPVPTRYSPQKATTGWGASAVASAVHASQARANRAARVFDATRTGTPSPAMAGSIVHRSAHVGRATTGTEANGRTRAIPAAISAQALGACRAR